MKLETNLGNGHDHFQQIDATFHLPLACIIQGPPKSGKTYIIKKILEHSDRLFDKKLDEIYWFYGEENDTVRLIKNTHPHLNITLIKGLPQSFDKYINSSVTTLIIIDDIMGQACASKEVTDLFCNKLQHTNTSTILCLQNLFYHGPERTTLIRCAHILFLLKNPLDQTIAMCVAQKLMPSKKKIFMDIFEEATKLPHGYLMVDGQQHTPDNARLRTNIFENGIQRIFQKNDFVRNDVKEDKTKLKNPAKFKYPKWRKIKTKSKRKKQRKIQKKLII